MPLIGATSSSFYASLRKPVLPPGIPTVDFENGDFEAGLNNWEVYNERVSPGAVDTSVRTTLLNCPIPADPTPYPLGTYKGTPTNSSGQARTFTGSAFSVDILTGGPTGKYASLRLRGTVGYQGSQGPNPTGGLTVYGPALVSKNPVIAEAGDRISFNWIATGGGDAYNVLAYIIDPDQSCKFFIMVDDTGNSSAATTPWTPAYKVIEPGEEGNYYFVFLSGSFDYNFGTYTGATLGVDQIKLEKAGTY